MQDKQKMRQADWEQPEMYNWSAVEGCVSCWIAVNAYAVAGFEAESLLLPVKWLADSESLLYNFPNRGLPENGNGDPDTAIRSLLWNSMAMLSEGWHAKRPKAWVNISGPCTKCNLDCVFPCVFLIVSKRPMKRRGMNSWVSCRRRRKKWDRCLSWEWRRKKQSWKKRRKMWVISNQKD